MIKLFPILRVHPKTGGSCDTRLAAILKRALPAASAAYLCGYTSTPRLALVSGSCPSDASGTQPVFGWTLILTLAACNFISCAPKVQEIEFPKPRIEFGPMQKDVVLDLKDADFQKIQPAEVIGISGEVESHKLLWLVANLSELGSLKDRAGIIRLAAQLMRSFYGGAGTTTHSGFETSSYINALIGASERDAQRELASAIDMIGKQDKVLEFIAREDAAKYSWPKDVKPILDLLLDVDQYTEYFIKNLRRRGVNGKVAAALEQQLPSEYQRLRSRALLFINRMAEAVGFLQTVDCVIQGLNEFQIPIPAEATNLLSQGRNVAAQINAFEDAQGALTVLVDIWNMLNAHDREAYFKPASPDLYEFFSGLNAEDLICLRDSMCLNPVAVIAKQVRIFPEINRYGIENLRKTLNDTGKNSVIAQIQKYALESLPQIPLKIYESISAELSVQQQRLEKIKGNYPNYIRAHAKNWADAKLEGKQFEVEINRSIIEMSSWNQIRVKGILEKSEVVTGARVIAAGLAASFNLAKAIKQEPSIDANLLRGQLIGQINKLLNSSGYRVEGGRLKPSFAQDMNPTNNKKEQLDLETVMDSTQVFAIPDSLRINPPASVAKYGEIACDEAQADLLQAFSLTAQYFQDWKVNSFDSLLGKIPVADLLPDLPRSELMRSLFPKPMFYALSLGNAGIILSNFQKSLTPIFLLNLDGEPVWANNFDRSSGSLATRAGIVSMQLNKRSGETTLAGVAKLILAISSFLEATDGIKNTQAPPLLKKQGNKQSPMEFIEASRAELRLLVIALANMIATRLQEPSGLVHTAIEIGNSQPKIADFSIRNQALAVQAMIAANRVGGAPIHINAALDAYFALNRYFWDPNHLFYRTQTDADTQPNVFDRVEVLLALEKIQPFLVGASKQQSEILLNSWLNIIEAF